MKTPSALTLARHATMFFFIPNTKEKGTAHHLWHVFRKGLLCPSLISASVSSVGPYFWNDNWGYPASDQLLGQG